MQFGERVHVRPRPGHRVQRGKDLFDQFLPAEGQEVTWDEFHQARLQDGSILLPPEHYHAERLAGALTREREAHALLEGKEAEVCAARIEALSEEREALLADPTEKESI